VGEGVCGGAAGGGDGDVGLEGGGGRSTSHAHMRLKTIYEKKPY